MSKQGLARYLMCKHAAHYFWACGAKPVRRRERETGHDQQAFVVYCLCGLMDGRASFRNSLWSPHCLQPRWQEHPALPLLFRQAKQQFLFIIGYIVFRVASRRAVGHG